MGFITSGKFLKSTYGKKIQQILLNETRVEKIVDLSELQVFGDATTYPIVIVFRKGKGESPGFDYLTVGSEPNTILGKPDLPGVPIITTPQNSLDKGIWPPLTESDKPIMNKLQAKSKNLGEISTNVFQGLITSADKVYHLDHVADVDETTVKIRSVSLSQELEMESGLLKPLLSGKHIQRYVAQPDRELLLFPYEVQDDSASLIPVGEFSEHYPLCWAYLEANKTALEDRERGKMRHDGWYMYGRHQSLALHERKKLAIPRLVQRLQVFYDSKGDYYLDNVDVGGVLLKDSSEGNYLYVLGVLNSTLINWYFQKLSSPFRGAYRSANKQFIEPLLIHVIDSDPERQFREAIIAKVKRMLDLQQRIAPIRNQNVSERDDTQGEIDRVDREIDDIVYDLYGLTDAERSWVEGDRPTT